MWKLQGRRRLVVVCVLVAVGETLLVSSLLPASSVALATQASAPPPFDLFHDLRWLVVYHDSWAGVAFELLAVLVLRTALLSVLVRTAWPRDVAPEPVAVTVRRSAIYVVVVSLLLAPWVGLMFGMVVVSRSGLFFVALRVLLMLVVLVAGGEVRWIPWLGSMS